MIHSQRTFRSKLSIAFLSENEAVMVQKCLEGDDELQPAKINKTFTVVGNILKM